MSLKKSFDNVLWARNKISVITDISILGFYGYINKISVNILTKISVKQKLIKIL